ncbi:MAG: hypothetical protein KDA96_24955 [Planctomycetaceae bacterium]|nr:hypothetical protein [Planctomycetaceae bacterium]
MMGDKTVMMRNAALLGAVAFVGATFLVFSLNKQLFPVAAVLSGIFGLLGVMIVVLTLRLREPRLQRTFSLVSGISAAGIPVSVVLHNLVYALCIAFFGEGFWGGSDEPFFFIMAILVFPALFVTGIVGNSVLLIRSRIKRSTATRAENS